MTSMKHIVESTPKYLSDAVEHLSLADFLSEVQHFIDRIKYAGIEWSLNGQHTGIQQPFTGISYKP